MPGLTTNATPIQTPTAGATSAIATPVKDNNVAATQSANAGYAAANPNVFSPAPTTSASTTTQSNSSKIGQIPGIQSTTVGLANNGITTNQNGVTTYANGEVYNSPALTESQNRVENGTEPAPTVTPDGKSITGGYSNGVYYAPGQVLQKDPTGNYPTLTPTDPSDDQIMNGLNLQKSQTDANTASLISNIQANYASLIQQQQIVNSSQAAGANNNRLMGGVTGQGSTAQFASKTSNSVFTSVLNQGIQALGALQAKENDAILQAQIAGENQDFQIQDKMNTEIQSIRADKQAAAQKINDAVQAQSQKLADETEQANKDNFVASQLQNGVTDPNQILKNAQDSGLTISADEVSKSMAALSPDKAQIQSLAAQAAAAGADASTVAKITGATNFNDAIKLATPALGAKVASDAAQQIFDNKIKQDQVNISQENANISYQHLLLDKQTAAGTQANAASSAVNATVQSNIPLPSGKNAMWVNGSNLDAAGTTAALNANQVVLIGTAAQGMDSVQNAMGQVNDLLSSLKTAGVDLTKVTDNSVGGTTNQGATQGFLREYAAGTATPALENFVNSLKGTGTSGTNSIINELSKYPNTGNLVSVLRNNIPDKGDSATIMNGKITNITNALISTGNNYLSTGAIPKGTPPAGQIWVQDNSTGQWGSIPPNEFDSNKYTQIP